MSKHAGSCLCGQVRFEIEGDFDRFFFCHCQRCRKGALPRERPGILVVPAGCLDTDVHTKPTAHIFIASRANWDNGLDTVPAFDGFPP